MKFVKTSSSQPAIEHLTQVLNEKLQSGKRVLWLLSGGLAIEVAVKVREGLRATKGLTVMQVDERFGPVGHPDSNWQKLLDAGFDTDGITCHPVLQDGKTLEQTAQVYEETLGATLKESDLSVGLFGLGADGHTAGIFPESPAITSDGLIYAFQGHDFPRITITASAIKQLDLAVAYAQGSDKSETLKNLSKDLPPSQQPAQILKQVEQSYVYNDSIGKTEGSS